MDVAIVPPFIKSSGNYGYFSESAGEASAVMCRTAEEGQE
jgi:hypothetical protein